MTCPACLKAKTDPHCADVRRNCAGCGIRELARLPKARRDAIYDAIEAQDGIPARQELVRCVREEHARIQALKGSQCRT